MQLPPSTAKGRILVADDEVMLARVMARGLTAEGYEAVVVHDGAAAIEQIRAGAFDVVISDIRMPGASGVDLLREIRSYDLDVPVILVTGGPTIETAALAVELGAMQYLTKPVTYVQLLPTVARACALHRMARLKREAMALRGRAENEAGDRAGLQANLRRALASMWVAWQPIVNASRQKVTAYEGLLRSNEPSLPNPGAVLDAAERLDEIHAVGKRVRALAAQDLATSFAPDALAFVNLHPKDLDDPDLYDRSSPLAAFAFRVVLELTERSAIGDIKDLRGRVAQLRQLGYRLAIDDLGEGYAGLSSFALLEPDFVKLDMSLVRSLDTAPIKQRIVGAMASVCADMGIAMIAEGVETKEERDALLALGCPLQQGYLFARPTRPQSDVLWP